MTNMQSADEEWEDEDWDDYDDDSGFLGISFGIKPILVTAFVVLLLLSSMIFTNFGFYFGAGSLSVLIDVNEGKDPGDRTFNANILATSPTFGMLSKEGEYSIHFDGAKQTSGKFEINDEGRGSFDVDYENFFVSNGEYVLKTELGGQTSNDKVGIYRIADSLRAEVVSFDGVTDNSEAGYPIDKDSSINLNMQFTSESFGTCTGAKDANGNNLNPQPETKSDCEIDNGIWRSSYVNPWVTGTAKVYHHEQPFNEDQGEDYWDDDSDHGDSAEQGSLVETISFDIDSSGGTYSYSSGTSTNFNDIQVGQVSLSLILDASEFYDSEGSGDYTVVFDFTNDFGTDTSTFDGRTYWAWFHVCETKSNGQCTNS
jgi:hypothetical protein